MSSIRRMSLVLLFLLTSRVLAMWLIPLNDSTEARYGEIARIMLETQNWITPMQQLGVPFWAKPPLSTWLSAGSMGLFGVNAMAARLPSLLLSIGVLWLVWDTSNRRSGRRAAWISVLVLASSVFFFLNAGTVMTDSALLFCTTLSLIAFWHAITNRKSIWGYVFFAGLGFGLLAKGPIAVVLVGLPVFVWVLMSNRWRLLYSSLPWFFGGLLMCLIAIPWYILAEIKTPGFLEYFIVGEHIHRFLDPGWTGDQYGFAHKAHYGLIWVYAVLGFLPWTAVGLIECFLSIRKSQGILKKTNDGWTEYLCAAIAMPLMFFTLSGNIIYPYAFPVLPFLALLFSDQWVFRRGVESDVHVLRLACISGVVCCVATVLFIAKPEWVSKSQNRVVSAYHAALASKTGTLSSTPLISPLIYWSKKTEFSSQFYSSGCSVSTLDEQILRNLLSEPGVHYWVMSSNESHPAVPADVRANSTLITNIPVLRETWSLYRIGSQG